MREPNNPSVRFAIAVVTRDTVVGHAFYNLAPLFSHFLYKDNTAGSSEVTEVKVNCGGGYVLEIACMYRLSGSKVLVDKLEKISQIQNFDLSTLLCTFVYTGSYFPVRFAE